MDSRDSERLSDSLKLEQITLRLSDNHCRTANNAGSREEKQMTRQL